MKKTDIAMIILIASISVFVAYLVAKNVFPDKTWTATVQTIQPIDSTIVDPSPEVFNDNAINPVVPVKINGRD